MKSYIHFIRHGITEGNQKGWYYGSLDIPLTEEGVAALKTLKEQKIYPPLDHADCYTSGLRRTEETFCTIYGDVPHKALPLLQEMNFGAWEGMSFKEIEAADTHREAFAEWMRSGGDSSSTFTFPDGGDSVFSFFSRIKEGIKELYQLLSATAESSQPRWKASSRRKKKPFGLGFLSPDMAIQSSSRAERQFLMKLFNNLKNGDTLK